jgi:hypothetical protein
MREEVSKAKGQGQEEVPAAVPAKQQAQAAKQDSGERPNWGWAGRAGRFMFDVGAMRVW